LAGHECLARPLLQRKDNSIMIWLMLAMADVAHTYNPACLSRYQTVHTSILAMAKSPWSTLILVLLVWRVVAWCRYPLPQVPSPQSCFLCYHTPRNFPVSFIPPSYSLFFTPILPLSSIPFSPALYAPL